MTVSPEPAYGTPVDTDGVRLERLLPGPIERVWHYLTDPDARATWLAAGAMELRVGGRVEHVFRNNTLTQDDDPPPAKYADIADECRFESRVTACEPPRLLAYTWPEADGDESEVRFELTSVGAKVRLVVTHRRLLSAATRLSVAAGWHAHLGVLRARLEGREPEGFWRSFVRLEAEYARRLHGEVAR